MQRRCEKEQEEAVQDLSQFLIECDRIRAEVEEAMNSYFDFRRQQILEQARLNEQRERTQFVLGLTILVLVWALLVTVVV
jgi:hypothetical protein